MKRRNCWVLAAAFAVIGSGALGECGSGALGEARLSISSHTGIRAIQLGRQKETLVGLKGVAVGFEMHFATPHGSGLKHTAPENGQLQSSIESILRRNGVEVLSAGELRNTHGPALIVSVSLDEYQVSDKVLVNIDLSLRQSVLLERDPNVSCYATTWRAKAVEFVNTDISEHVLRRVEHLAEKFVKDYLAANSKATNRSSVMNISTEKMTWVMCRNSECKAEYEITLRDYFIFVEENADPRRLIAPPLHWVV